MLKTRLIKRCLPLVLALILLLSAGGPASAARKAAFPVINDRFLDLSDETMPLEKDGRYYVPYTFFLSGFGSIKSFYSVQEQVLVLYDKDNVISFDIANGYTYDQQMHKYNESALSIYGTVFVPARFICSTWGFYYSVIQSAKGPLVRISKTTPSLSDNMLLYLGESVMNLLISQYEQKTSVPPQKPAVTPPPAVRKSVYLTFDGSPSGVTPDILKTLSAYRYRATFFCSKNNTEGRDDIVRQIIIDGHTLALNAASEESGAGDVIKQLSDTNRMLNRYVKTTSRIVRITDAGLTGLNEDMRDSLFDSGYRLWDYTVEGLSKNTAYSIQTSVINALKRTTNPAVVMLGNRDIDSAALKYIVSFLKQNNYIVLPIYDWEAPINAYQDIR